MVTSNIEKFLHVLDLGGESVVRQAVEENLAVALLGDAVIQQDQNAAVGLAPNEPPETLLQRDGRTRNLVIVERISPRRPDALDAGVDHRIARYRERQFIYEDRKSVV